MAEQLRILRSPLIDESVFVHGFPERGGGISIGEHRASLSLGAGRGGDEQNVAENRRRVAAAAGYDADALVVTKHVHGTGVWRLDQPLPEPAEFDGLVSNRAGVVLGAFGADCLPLLFADKRTGVCAAAHAGWRGTVAKIAVRVVERMGELGAVPAEIVVALGPSIGPCCFEVGAEVTSEFRAAFPSAPGVVVDGPKKEHVDLRAATRAQLEAVGLAADHIDSTPPCTMCHPDRFFSYRRDGSGAGTHMGFIARR